MNKNPVLYPNNHLKQAGQAAADRDIAECRQLAGSSGVAETKDGKVARQTAGGAAVGVASAGAWGLVRGNDAGELALAGAAAGAAAGTVHKHGNPLFLKTFGTLVPFVVRNTD